MIHIYYRAISCFQFIKIIKKLYYLIKNDKTEEKHLCSSCWNSFTRRSKMFIFSIVGKGAFIIVVIVFCLYAFYLLGGEIKLSFSPQSNKISGAPAIASIFDLSKPLTPNRFYDEIECKRTKVLLNRSTTICLYDLKQDAIVSGSIVKEGVWEETILSKNWTWQLHNFFLYAYLI